MFSYTIYGVPGVARRAPARQVSPVSRVEAVRPAERSWVVQREKETGYGREFALARVQRLRQSAGAEAPLMSLPGDTTASAPSAPTQRPTPFSAAYGQPTEAVVALRGGGLSVEPDFEGAALRLAALAGR